MKKVVYVDMDALEEEAAVSCWRPVGARTDRKLGLIKMCAWWLVALATLKLLSWLSLSPPPTVRLEGERTSHGSAPDYGDMNGSSSWAGKCLTGDDP